MKDAMTVARTELRRLEAKKCYHYWQAAVFLFNGKWKFGPYIDHTSPSNVFCILCGSTALEVDRWDAAALTPPPAPDAREGAV